ncbi:HNH endonuclease signature motif containing protein [Aspergillus affinis]|uniref:HNH endonuclease signature motif containing protein n=1 Tax=Aspergillus affinis TaxID=1070780 RepID=UPI0022FE6AA7|nr:uncharacterized protein KD926_006112 [Aspergillus affinis]KAI9042192.1 hypothetical protein KD926_006112 [Aspergillus affinis]
MPFQQFQSSFIEALNTTPPLSLPSHLRLRAASLLDTFIHYYGLERTTRNRYKPSILIQATFQHVVCKDAFLMFFLAYIYGVLSANTDISVGSDIMAALVSYFDDFDSWDSQQKSDLTNAIEDFAENFITHFLLPIKSGKTPQPTAESLAASIEPSSSPDTPQSISILRQQCFERDRCRCVVSRKFDKKEAERRFDQQGEECKDNDGELLKNESHIRFAYLKISHILPYRITKVAPGDFDISESKKNVLRMLDWFEPGVSDLIDGAKIHSPSNALTLAHKYHRLFGDFQICFEPTGIPNQYTIESIQQFACLRDSLFPVTRTLTFSPTIDAPSPRLLAIHHIIAQIIHLSGVATYLDEILQDLEVQGVKEDGSTHLGHLTTLRFGGW